MTIETEDEPDEEDEGDYDIEKLVNVFETKGYGLKDALSLLMYKFSKTDPKYTKEYIKQLEQDIDDMNDDLRNEYDEQVSMQAEDISR
jgi:hypothetical protein